MEIIQLATDVPYALNMAIADGTIPCADPDRNLPGAEMGERIKAASMVWNYLHSSKDKTPIEIIRAFDEICERLGIPYVITCQVDH